MLRFVKWGGVILSLWCGWQPSFAVNAAGTEVIQQHGTCTGIVKDSAGETIIGASVVVKETSNGTITGIDGDFSLKNVPLGSIIQISFVGYQAQEVKWTGTPLNIVLKEDSKMLEEVVVVGFGTQKKVNLTGAVSTVDSKTLASRPVNSVVDALQGAVPGMNFAVGKQGGALNSKDRKSTRLNSSHANISYAAFCLKKKYNVIA